AIAVTGNEAIVPDDPSMREAVADLPLALQERVAWTSDWRACSDCPAILIAHDMPDMDAIMQDIAAMSGPIPLVQIGDESGTYRTDWMIEEVSLSVNTTAAGGNASLMAVA
ncbi:MAG: hypothetical protein ACK5NN_08770, partial [Sphingomonadaceae bacterium]